MIVGGLTAQCATAAPGDMSYHSLQLDSITYAPSIIINASQRKAYYTFLLVSLYLVATVRFTVSQNKHLH